MKTVGFVLQFHFSLVFKDFEPFQTLTIFRQSLHSFPLNPVVLNSALGGEFDLRSKFVCGVNSIGRPRGLQGADFMTPEIRKGLGSCLSSKSPLYETFSTKHFGGNFGPKATPKSSPEKVAPALFFPKDDALKIHDADDVTPCLLSGKFPQDFDPPTRCEGLPYGSEGAALRLYDE